MYLTHPDQVIKVWNEIVIVIKHFESMKRELNPSKTEFVSIRGTEYFGEMEKIIGILNKTPIFDRVFQDLTIYHSHDIVSQRCRDNGISYLNR